MNFYREASRTAIMAVLALMVAHPGLGAAPATARVGPSALLLGDYLGGRTAQLEHDWRTAGPLMRKVWEANRDDPELRHDALLLSVAGGDFPGAVEIARGVPQDSSDAPLANFVLTLDDLADGRFAEVATKLAAKPAQGVDRYIAPLLTAWSEVGRGRKTEAEAALAPLASVEGAGELRALQTALIADAAGDHARAAVLFGDLLDGKPSPRALAMAAWFYRRQGEPDQAKAAIERIDPEGASASLRTELLLRLADKSRLRPAPDARSGAAEALFEIAASLTSQEQADLLPLLYAQLALHLRPDFPSAQILMGEIDQRWGRLEDSAATLMAVDPKSDLSSTAQRLAMATLYKANEGDKALKLGRAAVAAHPEDIDLLISYADLLRQTSHFAEAIAAYDSALAKIQSTSVRRGVTLFHRGIAYQQAHQWPHAEADLLAALQLRPDDPGVLNYLAFSWADQGVNLDRARTMLERAVQLAPEDGAIIDSLGWVMFRAGDYADAVTQLEHAVALDADDATVTDHLGDAYWRVGRKIEAKAEWERAAILTQDAALAAQIRIKLRDGLDDGSAGQHAAN